MLAILLVTLTVSVIGLALNTQRDLTRMQQATIESLLVRLSAMKVDFVKVLTDHTSENAVELVDELNVYEDMHYIVLRDNNERVVFRYSFHGHEPHELPDFIRPDSSSAIIYGDDNIMMHHTVMYGGKRYGWVSIWVDAVDLKEQYREYALTAVLLLLGTVLVTLVLAALAGHYFSRPIRILAEFIRGVSDGHDFSRRLAAGQKGEIGDLYDGVNVMLDEIAVAEDEIFRLNETRVRHIVESAMDGVISVDGTGVITYWSKQAELIFGWGENKILGRSIADTVMPERYREQYNKCLVCFGEENKKCQGCFLVRGEDNIVSRRLMLEGLHYDGYEVPLEVSLSASWEHDRWIFNAFVRDLSDQKKAEQDLRDIHMKLLRKERLATVGQLTATVAHELRNPMGTVQNTLYLLAQKCAGKERDTVDLFDRINRNIKRCDTIISELLDFTRDRDVSLVPTMIDTWLAGVLSGYQCPDGIELDYKPESDARVPMDNAYFESAVINILNNAMQAAAEKHPGGGGRVTLGTVARNGRVGVVISDNGPGIEAADHERAFEVLYSTRVYGVGLGLPTVKKVMEKHGGEVCLETGFAGGLQVTLWLPAGNPSGGSNTL